MLLFMFHPSTFKPTSKFHYLREISRERETENIEREMAEECIDICSVGASSSTPAAWWDVHPDSVSSWRNTNPSCWNQKNPNSISSCDEEVSISTSALSVVSNGDLISDHVSDNQLWSHVLLSIGNNGEIHTNQEVGGNYMNRLSSKLTDSSTSMIEPACNYLKKLECGWEDDHFSNSSPSFNSFDDQKQPIEFSESMIENERLLRLSDLVSSWSIALPDPETTRHFNNNTNQPSMNSYVKSLTVHDINQSLSNSGSIGTIASDSESFSCYDFDQDMKLDQKGHHQEIEIPGDLFRRSFNGSGEIGYQAAINGSSTLGGDCKDYLGTIIPRTPSRNLADFISFTNRFRKPLMNIQAQKPSSKFSNLSERKRQNLQNSSPTIRAGGRELGASSTDRRKKKSEDHSDSAMKKPKLETSTPSSAKQPKVKIAEKITTLQQIVSPFGKTDTASVLSETIGYIKFLQEQVQLLSNPYMKTSFHKDPWGGMERREKGEVMKFDLKSRGLCLVPISCTPQVCHENNGSDHYWTPYRGCFYR